MKEQISSLFKVQKRKRIRRRISRTRQDEIISHLMHLGKKTENE